jgi:hypothetical protein
VNKLTKLICAGSAGLTLMFCAGAASAAPVTYNYVITGEVLVGDEIDANLFGLTGNSGEPGGETITAVGTFTADLSAAGDVSVLFGLNSGNTMTIFAGSQTLFASDSTGYNDDILPELVFNSTLPIQTPKLTAGSTFLYVVDYLKESDPTFNSQFLSFDDLSASSLFGDWISVELTPVPVPAALWLLGSGLLGLIGIARRRS